MVQIQRRIGRQLLIAVATGLLFIGTGVFSQVPTPSPGGPPPHPLPPQHPKPVKATVPWAVLDMICVRELSITAAMERVAREHASSRRGANWIVTRTGGT